MGTEHRTTLVMTTVTLEGWADFHYASGISNTIKGVSVVERAVGRQPDCTFFDDRRWLKASDC